MSGVTHVIDPYTGNVKVVPTSNYGLNPANNPTASSVLKGQQTILGTGLGGGVAPSIAGGHAVPNPGALAVPGCDLCTSVNLGASGALQTLGIQTSVNPVLIWAAIGVGVLLILWLLVTALH